jgi:hypothetical protein
MDKDIFGKMCVRLETSVAEPHHFNATRLRYTARNFWLDCEIAIL